MRAKGKIPDDKERIINILLSSFYDNKSVNYIIQQDSSKEKRIKALMEYSFNVCKKFGTIYLSDTRNACALISYPHKKRNTPKSILSDAKFIFNCLGLFNIKRAIQREALIKKNHPKTPFIYIWFIGTQPSAQRKGIGTALLKQIITDAATLNLPIYLETSTIENLPWYEKHGFEIYNVLDFGYKLYCMKLE